MLKYMQIMRALRQNKVFLLPVLLACLSGCRESSVPKPTGYFRIDLPKREYIVFDGIKEKIKDLPFSFEYPAYGKLSTLSNNKKEPGWLNIDFPFYKAKIYLTYKEINKNFESLMEQTYTMNVKNHISKAEAINEQVFSNPGRKVFGILYDLKGNTASAVQFYVTDSVKNYLRGSLYFAAEPDADSLEPVINFFRGDIIHLIETLKWKN
jgi:gliding motility-associated lipoprotein GldD